jgi:MoaA/NifB/PqqE/SkfB family radical SAM enzyme
MIVRGRLRGAGGAVVRRLPASTQRTVRTLAGRPAPEPADIPVGVKLELTYRCNLRCGFCYTDSPRRTLERPPELSDAQWCEIADESIAAGVVEAVITGGEPLLRSELACELLSRFSTAGVTVNLNTNGWFVDERLADALAAHRSVRVIVSIDGATAAIHDQARGVPGSWHRAVRAIDALLARGVPVGVNHVVMPRNVDGVESFLDQMWLLGVRRVRLTPVGPVGAAAREGGWEISERKLRRAAARARALYGSELRIERVEERAFQPREQPPSFMLVRPDGTAMLDSLHPFGFGNVAGDGVLGAWRTLCADWDAPAVRAWRAARRRNRAAVLPYRDEEISPITEQTGARPPPRPVRLPAPVGSTRPSPEVDGAPTELALRRRYRVGDVSVGRDAGGFQVVHVLDRGSAIRINATAAAALSEPGTEIDGATIVARLARSNPSVAPARLTRDALGLTRSLQARGVLIPTLARRSGDQQ